MTGQRSMTLGMVTMTYPDGWDEFKVEGISAGLARVILDEFCPSILVETTDSDSPIELASAEVIVSTFELEDARIISCEAWDQNSTPGRLHLVSYPLGDSTVIVSRWVWSTGDHVIVLTASCASYQFLEYAGVFESMARSMIVGEVRQ